MISILPQNGFHFAAKRNAFCRKMEFDLPQNISVLGQNRWCFGPKWFAFWPKMEKQNGGKVV